MARHRPTQDPYTRPAIFTLERLHAEPGGVILENRQKYDELQVLQSATGAAPMMFEKGVSSMRLQPSQPAHACTVTADRTLLIPSSRSQLGCTVWCLAAGKGDPNPLIRVPYRSARPVQFRRRDAQYELVRNTSLTWYIQVGAAVRQITDDAAEGAPRKFDHRGFEDAPPAYVALFHDRKTTGHR
jgi:hypothetical protein